MSRRAARLAVARGARGRAGPRRAGVRAQRRRHRRRRRAAARARRQPAGHRAADVRLRRPLRGLLPRHHPAPRRADHRRPGEPGRPALRARRQHRARQPRPPGRLRHRRPRRRAYRIVWHYRATDEQRTTTISYRVIDAVVAYDDVLDVGWGVWGDQWEFDLDHLSAELHQPGARPRRPALPGLGPLVDDEGESRVDGETVARRQATLEAEDVRSGTAVELRVTMPRDPAGALPGGPPRRGRGPAADPRVRAGARRRLQLALEPVQALRRRPRLAARAGDRALAWLLVLLLIWLARERETGVPEYLPEPPDDAAPGARLRARPRGRQQRPTRCSRRCSTWSTAATTRPARRPPRTRSSTWR